MDKIYEVYFDGIYEDVTQSFWYSHDNALKEAAEINQAWRDRTGDTEFQAYRVREWEIEDSNNE